MYGDLSSQCNCNAAVPLSTLNYPVPPGDVAIAIAAGSTIVPGPGAQRGR